MSDFSRMIGILEAIGVVDYNIPLNRNGKPSKFLCQIRSNIGNKEMNMGLLHYNWKRTIGVDKINQALQYANQTNLDGAFVIGSTFSQSAIEQANRINQVEEKKILLIETEKLDPVSFN